MSRKVREWLKAMRLYEQTSHEQRLAIDKEIEQRKGVYCDKAIGRGLVSEAEFREIVELVCKRKKKKKKNEIPIVV